VDVASIDWLFPRGLDHHSMFAGVPVADKVMAKVARHLAGLGLLPDAPRPLPHPPERVQAEVAVVGGGAAGLAAARALAVADIRPLILEQEDRLGGRLVLEAPEEHGEVDATSAPIGADVRLGTSVLGLYDDDLGRVLVAVQHAPDGPRILLVKSRAVLFALGGHASVLAFENNDIPGVFSGRAASDLLLRRRILVGDAPAMVGRLAAGGAPSGPSSARGARPALVLTRAPSWAVGRGPPGSAPRPRAHLGARLSFRAARRGGAAWIAMRWW
jgi:sarcosine oxidase subunit alpha